ncbi:MAG: hypothetical protein WBA03_08460 [Marinomonas sp.]|uniref:hypothetical protein n=1 Tax=Marinomonas sp. TaxID=1904862 RepID=UPI003C7138F9
MELALLIPICLLGGFLYCKVSYRQYIKIHRYSDQHLYLQSALSSLLPLLLSSLFALATLFFLSNEDSKIGNLTVSSTIKNLISNNSENALSSLPSFSYITAVLIPIISWFLAKINNLHMHFFGENKAQYRKSCIKLGKAYTSGILTNSYLTSIKAAQENKAEIEVQTRVFEVKKIVKGNPLDFFFYTEYTQTRSVEIITTSNTVFIGGILNIGEPNEQDGLGPEIAILTIATGYVCQRTHKNRLNTLYPEHIRKKIPTYIRLDQITSARPFIAENYTKDDIDPPKKDSPQMNLI